MNPMISFQNNILLNIEETRVFALIDPHDLDLQNHKTIGFFPVPSTIFIYSLIKFCEELQPVEHRQEYL